MKRLVLMAVVAIATLSMGAQNYLVENPENKAYFGARVGIDISSISQPAYDTYDNGVGFTVGGIYNIPLWKNLYFEPGLSLFYNTFGETIYTNSEVIEDLPIPTSKATIRNWGFRIPMHAGYHFDFTDDISIHVITGPALNLNLSAKYNYMGKSTNMMEYGFRRFDLQWDFGVAMNYDEHYYVSLTGGVGLTQAYHNSVDHFKRNTFSIAVGYNF